ncbi:MAG: hypothetical protein ACLSXK_05615 [Lactococcus petauri]
MTIKKIKNSMLILLSLGVMLGFMTGCSKKETPDNQDHSSVKIVENNDDVEFKDPNKK